MTDFQSALDLLDTYVPDESIPQDQTIKLLRALVEYAPTGLGKHNICQDILACQSSTTSTADSAKLRQLKDRYMAGFIIPMVAKGGKTPQVSEHPSRGENGPLIDNAKHEQAKSKTLALARDNYRSVMTGHIDCPSADRDIVPDISPDAMYTFTEPAHVLPFSLSEGETPEQLIRHNAEVWKVIERFSGTELSVEFKGQNINRLGNTLTLSMSEHKCFGSLKCWFEAIEGQPNTYRVDGRMPLRGIYNKGAIVTFTTTSEELELPDSRYLAIHAACAKVVFASGMAEFIDRVMRDLEELAALREDGSSADVLMFALQCNSVH